MTGIEIRRIDSTNASDARLPNQPFTLWGRLCPSLEHGVWSYAIETSDKTETDCFPDENYDPARDDAIFLGAYRDGVCIGLAVLREDAFRYLYLDDLKVNADQRGKGVGGRLIDACMREAKERGLQGVYTVGQDNNLSACLFYLHHGFDIGGFDNRVYRGTKQETKANIIFYRDC